MGLIGPFNFSALEYGSRWMCKMDRSRDTWLVGAGLGRCGLVWGAGYCNNYGPVFSNVEYVVEMKLLLEYSSSPDRNVHDVAGQRWKGMDSRTESKFAVVDCWGCYLLWLLKRT